jgi:small GTP-binding protein
MNVPNVVVLGPHSCGKTALLDRLITAEFSFNTLPTQGASFHQWKGISFWDTSGTDDARTIALDHLRQCDVVIACYQSNDPTSYMKLKPMMMNMVAPGKRIFIVRTKCDLLKIYDGNDDQGFIDLSLENNITMHETSSLSGHGIPLLFEQVENYCRAKYPSQPFRSISSPAVCVCGII